MKTILSANPFLARFLALGFLCCLGTGCSNHFGIRNYKGTAYGDSVYQSGVQRIPGKIQCEYFDRGGEGVAYHDEDRGNSGSGALNPADGTYLHEFRMKEDVDTSFTKPAPVDEHKYNLVDPIGEQLYVGWTKPGEWMHYSVRVAETGLYQVGMMYTCNGNGRISLDVDGTDRTGPMDVITTHDDKDPIDWRQWHHWNFVENLAEIHLEKGFHLLTLHTVSNGNMNYDYLLFSLKNETLLSVAKVLHIIDL